jgi:hypothetical protein
LGSVGRAGDAPADALTTTTPVTPTAIAFVSNGMLVRVE